MLRSGSTLALGCLAVFSGCTSTLAFSPSVSLVPRHGSALAAATALKRDFVVGSTPLSLRTRRDTRASVRMMSSSPEPFDKERFGEGIEGWVEESSAKAEMLEKAFALQVDCFTMDSAKLRNKKGEVIDPSTLRGKSVALYFSCAWCPQCVEFTPFLKKFYEEQKGKVEIVFVSSDNDEAQANECFHKTHGDWLMLDYNSPLTDEYKMKHGVWAGKEAAKFGNSIAAFKGRKSGVPAVMVLMLDGEVCRFLPAEQQGLACLLKWDVEDVAWPK